MKKKDFKKIYLDSLHYDDDVEFIESELKEKHEKELDDNYIDYGGE